VAGQKIANCRRSADGAQVPGAIQPMEAGFAQAGSVANVMSPGSDNTGPKNRPTLAVPVRCTAKSKTMITTVIGMINGSSSGCTTRNPSTAESTEMAGVIMLSARSNDAPKMQSVASHRATRVSAYDDVVDLGSAV
jgi:hypothetical protein